jgi:hypothetical protein
MDRLHLILVIKARPAGKGTRYPDDLYAIDDGIAGKGCAGK